MAGIVIAGCHRSGTSALAGALARLGWVLPSDMVGAGRGNERGHFESHAVVQANDRILDACDRLWFDPKPLPDGWSEATSVLDALGAAGDLLASEFEGQPYLVKDPRLSLLLPLWRAPLEAFGGPPMVLIACRNPYEIAKSLKKRNGFNVPHGLALWQSYMLEAERNTRGLDRMIVHFEDLLADGSAVLARIMRLAGSGLAPEPKALNEAAHSFENRDRHVKIEREEFLANDKAAVDIRDLYRNLLEPDALDDAGNFDAAHAAWKTKWRNESAGDGPSALAMNTAGYARVQGQKAIAAGNLPLALKHVRRGLALNPDEADLHLMCGKILSRTGNAPAAIDSLRAAVRLKPAISGGAHLLAAAMRAAGDTEEAIAVTRQGLDARPDDVDLLTLLSQILAERGEVEAAVYHVGVAAGLGGMTTQLALLLCTIFRKAGRKRVALGYARQASKLAAGEPRLQIQAAIQIAKCGAAGEAETLLRALAEEGETRSEAQAALDRLLERQAPT